MPEKSCGRRQSHAMLLQVSMLLLPVILMLVREVESGEPDDSAFLSVVADGNLSHRESFRYINCRYRIRTGTAETGPEAEKNGPTELHAEHFGRWVVRENQACLVLHSGPGVRQSEWSMYNKMRITDGNLLFTFYSHLESGSVCPVNSALDGFDGTPFDLWMFGKDEAASPGHIIHATLARPENERMFPVSLISRSPLVRFKSGNLEFPGEQSTEYVLDGTRGYAMSAISFYSKAKNEAASTTRAIVTDWKDCGNSRWFPMRAVTYSSGEDAFSVREWIVDELNVDSRPADEDLSIVVPAESEVNDLRSAGSQIVLVKEPRRISVTNLDELYKHTQDAIVTSKLAEERDLIERMKLGRSEEWKESFNASER